MKKIILVLSVMLLSSPSWALKPSLDPAVKLVNDCLATQGTLLCNDGIIDALKADDVNVDARGEFAGFLTDLLQKNSTEKVIANLYKELQVLVPVYEQLDTPTQWSSNALRNLLGAVSISYVKIAPIDTAFLIDLYKKQSGENLRYNFLLAINEKAAKVSTTDEIDGIIHFAEFAKDYSRAIGDEAYVSNTSVELIRVMTVKSLQMRPGYEGIYAVAFDDSEAAKNLNIDKVVIMQSNDRDSLVVNFVASTTRAIKFSFKASGVLGDHFFSNQDVYNNTQDAANPYFKIDLDRSTMSIKGIFSTARYGQLSFSGRLQASNVSVYSQINVKGLSLDQLVGKYSVKVGAYDMTLIISKRTDERTTFEGALFNDNAMMSFSKVSLDSDRGVLSLVDINNERKLTLGVVDFGDKTVLKGQFLNAPQSKVLDVQSN